MSVLKQEKKSSKFAFLLLFTILLIMFLPTQTKVKAASTDIVNIPDAVLKAELNEYLGVDDSAADITQGQLAELEGITVGWYNSKVSDLTGLEYCTNLEWLYIYSGNESLDLSALSNMPKLEKLGVYGGGLKDPSQIEVCNNLTDLVLDLDDLTKVPNVPTLTYLKIYTNGTETKTDLSAIKNMTGITNLRLEDVKSDDYSSVSALTKLTQLTIYDCDIVTAPNLSGMTELASLDFTNCDYLEDISGLTGLTSTTWLSLEGAASLTDLSPIAGMKNVTYLDLESTNIFDDEQYNSGNANTISKLTKLENLNLAYSDVTDTYTYMFLPLNNLESLTLGYTDITDLSFLAYHADNLKKLSVYGTHVDNKNTAILAQMKNLVILEISRTYITDFSFIAQMPSLTNDSFRWNQWTTSVRTTTYSAPSIDILTTDSTVTIKNDVIDNNGNYVVPTESDKWSYDPETNTITVAVNTNSTTSSVTVTYEFDMTSQTGKTLCAAHRKTIIMNRKKPLAITTQPKSSIIMEGTETQMSVVAEGAGTLSYQWYKDGVALIGETGSTITFADAKVDQSGSYTVKVTDSYNNMSVTSEAAVLNVIPQPISITKQPTGFSTTVGESGSLTVTVVGAEPLTYQWYKDGVAVDGATGSTLTFNNIMVSQAGSYYVVICDKHQQTKTSNAVDVEVSYAEVALSAKVSTANATTVDKVTITATATGGSKTYLYKYYVYNTTTQKYTYLTEYISNSSYGWTPAEPGTYNVYVVVKDELANVEVTSSAMTVTVVYPELKVSGAVSSAEIIEGDKLTITANATGGTGSYTYNYLVYHKGTNAWTNLTVDFVESNTYVWTTGIEGEYAIYVEVRDSEDRLVRSSAVDITVKQKPLAVTAKTSVSEVCTGNKVKIIATATGGSEEYTYKYLIYNVGTKAWAALSNGYIADASFTWTAGAVGERLMYVDVKDSDGNVTRSSAVTLNVIPQPLKIQGTSSVDSVMLDEKVTITATATGGVKDYTYSYLVLNKQTGVWARLTSFGASSSFTWTAGSLGTREFYVEVKDSQGTVTRSSAIPVKVTPQPLKITAESSTASVMTGNKITISATATGGVKGYTYSYLVLNKGTGEWARLTSFGANSSFTWTAGSLGNRAFYVEVKDSQGTVTRSAAVPVKVTPLPLEITIKSSADTVAQGSTVKISATATGGIKDYTYSYLVKNITTNTWIRLTAFADTNSFTWTAGNLGIREFYVEVKDSQGTITRSSAVTVEVVPPPLTVTGESSGTSVMQGESVEIRATAEGGVKDYTYSFLILNKKTGEWARLTSFKAENTYTWTAGSLGDRAFYVEVKDSQGTITRSKAVTVKVTPLPLEITAESSATSVMQGEKVTFTATATGGTGGYTYSYLVYNVKTCEWARLTSFKSTNTYTWIAGSLADRRFYVEVKDSAGTVTRSSAVTVKVTS